MASQTGPYLHHLRVAVVSRPPERGVEGIILRLHVRSVVEQLLGDVDVAHAGGHVQRGQVVLSTDMTFNTESIVHTKPC